MWNELVTALDAFRSSVPWQFPTMAIIILLSIIAIWMDEWLKRRRKARIQRMLLEPFRLKMEAANRHFHARYGRRDHE